MTTQTKVSIGGSTAAAACGLDPFRSRVQLWLELTGRVAPPDESEQMFWGTMLEPVIREVVDTRGYTVGPAKDKITAEWPWAIGHLDGYVRQGPVTEPLGVLEIKTTNQYRAREWADDQVPTAYIIQVSHYMALTGLTWALVACLIGGQRLELRRVERDETLIENLMRAEEEFVRLVETDTAPAPDGSESADAMLKLLYPDAEPGKRVQLTGEAMEVVARVKTLKKAEKENDRQLDEAEQIVKAYLGDASEGWYEGVKVASWPTIKSHRLDGSRLKEERPDVYGEYLKESNYRALRIVGS